MASQPATIRRPDQAFWSAPAERSGDGAWARLRSSRKLGPLCTPAESKAAWRFASRRTPKRRRNRFLGVRRQSAAATALWLAPEGRANPDLRHVLRIQSGVALRFPPHSKTPASPLAVRFVIVVNLQLVDLEPVDRPHLRRGGGALEPRRRTPRILIGHRHQPMLHRILMNVVEPRTI